jgi:hypothetical protein
MNCPPNRGNFSHTTVGNVDMLNVAKMAVHLPANNPAE